MQKHMLRPEGKTNMKKIISEYVFFSIFAVYAGGRETLDRHKEQKGRI